MNQHSNDFNHQGHGHHDRDRRFELCDLEEMIAELSPIVLRKVRPSADGETNPYLAAAAAAAKGFRPPIDVEARLTAMLYMGGNDASIHGTQVSVTAALLNSGMPIDDVVRLVLAATHTAAGDYGARWNWRREEKAIHGMCVTWLRKHPVDPNKKTDGFQPDDGAKPDDDAKTDDSTKPDDSAKPDDGADDAKPKNAKDQKQQKQKEALEAELIWHGDNEDVAERRWLTDKMIPLGVQGIAAGQWGACKTFGMMDLAACVMTATPFAGREVLERGGVLFVAAEGAEEVSIRLKAVVEHKLSNRFNQSQIDPAIDLSCLPFVSIRRPIRFSTDKGYQEMLAVTTIAAACMLQEYKVPLKLIIIDTMQASVDFKDGNDSAENQRVMNCLAGIARETGATAIIVDHFGKTPESGTKGSSSKEDFAFFVLAFLADRDIGGSVSNTRMAQRKLRSGKSGAEFPFDLVAVDITDEETSCVIEWKPERGDGKDTSKKDKWTAALSVFHTSITTALIDFGVEKRPYGNAGPLVRAVPLDKVRAEFHAAYPAANSTTPEARDDAKRKAFERGVKQARARNLIGSRDLDRVDYLWLVQDDEAEYLKKRGKSA